MRNKSFIIAIILLIIAGVTATYLFHSIDGVGSTQPQSSSLSTQEEWKSYEDSVLKFALEYPSDWNLEVISEPRSSGGFYSVILTKRGNEISIGRAGRGIADYEWTYPEYSLGGATTEARQAVVEGGYRQLIVANGVAFAVETENLDKDTTDQILSTVVFLP